MAIWGFHYPVSYSPRSLLFTNAFFSLYSNIGWFLHCKRCKRACRARCTFPPSCPLGLFFFCFSVISRWCLFMTAFNTHTKRKAWRGARVNKRDWALSGKNAPHGSQEGLKEKPACNIAQGGLGAAKWIGQTFFFFFFFFPFDLF